MNELIARLVANVGVDQAAAEKSVGIILDFLKKEGPPDKVQALIDKLPGAEALLAAQAGESGGMFAMGGLMGAGTKMIAYAREKAGEDTIGEIVGSIPGLGQFI